MKLLRDVWLIFQRQVVLLWRNPVWVFVGIFQPVMYLLLFAPLLKPALEPLGVTTNAEVYRVFVPGLLVLLAIFGGLFQGFGLIAELRAGVIERSRVTPVSRVALLLGRSLRDVVSLLVQAVIITLLALLFDLRVQLLDLLLAYLMLALISLMTSAVSYGVALAVKSEDVLAPLMNTVAQRLFLLSGILLPLFSPGVAAAGRHLEPVRVVRSTARGRCSRVTSATTGVAGAADRGRAHRSVGVVGGASVRPQRALRAALRSGSDALGVSDPARSVRSVPRLVRDRTTLLIYAQLAIWGYFLYGFGPVVPLLRDEQGVSAALAGLHGTGLALGIVFGVLGPIADVSCIAE